MNISAQHLRYNDINATFNVDTSDVCLQDFGEIRHELGRRNNSKN